MYRPIVLLLVVLLAGCQAVPSPSSSHGEESDAVEKKRDAQHAQLSAAAEKGDTKSVLKLLEDGADINATDEQGRTAAMAATYYNHTETVQALIEKGADINIRDDNKNNVLLYASASGMLDIVKLAVEAGADTTLTNRYGGTALIPASERGHVEVVEELLAYSDVDVNHINDLHWTALLEAVLLGDGGERHQHIVQLLLDHGADIQIGDRDGIPPLTHANKRGFQAIANQLRKQAAMTAGKQISELNRDLLAAANEGDNAAVAKLLTEGADIDTTDERGRTAAMIAVHTDQLELFALLVEQGANINIRDQRQDNPLLYAGAEGKLDFLKAALAAGADTSLTNRFRGTALIPAAERGHVEVVRELLTNSDVDVNHINDSGWTALLEAIVLGNGGSNHQEIVNLLIAHGADVNLADKRGITPLQHAKKRGYHKIENALTSAGAT